MSPYRLSFPPRLTLDYMQCTCNVQYIVEYIHMYIWTPVHMYAVHMIHTRTGEVT